MLRLGRESGGLQNFLVGTGLIAIGGCLGILLGSLLDAPRLVMNRFYKPVQTVQLEVAEETEPANALELSEYRALQEKQKPVPKVALPEAPEKPASKVAKAPKVANAPALPVVSATRVDPPPSNDKPQPIERAEPESGATKEALIASIKQTTPHPVPELAPIPDPTPRKRSKPENAPQPRQQAESPPASPAREASRSRLVVQVAAYADVPTALRLVSELQQSGFDAYVSPKSAAGPYPHRVRVRPGGSQRAAELAERLKGAGYSVWTTRE